MTVFRILQSQQLKPYYLQKVQAFEVQDGHFPLLVYAKIVIELFFGSLMIIDKADFTCNGIANVHDYHYWAENPSLHIPVQIPAVLFCQFLGRFY